MGKTNIPVQALWLKMGGAYGWDSMVLVHAFDFLYTCTHVIVHAQEISEGLSFMTILKPRGIPPRVQELPTYKIAKGRATKVPSLEN